jgi:hypothetical protein
MANSSHTTQLIGIKMNDLYDESHRLFSYDAETGLLTRKVSASGRWGKPQYNAKAGDVIDATDSDGYLHTTIKGKRHKVHRIIWLMVTGYLPVNYLDHINGNRADNRLSNLREATHSENLCNRGKSKNNSTGFKGVFFERNSSKNPYMARIGIGGKPIYLGHFPTPELAYEAYCKKATELHGEFAKF